MLGKLIKHEWKAVSKVLALLHLLLIAMAVVGKILLSIEVLKEEWLLWGTLMTVYVISIMAICIGTQIFMAVRFYKNMYTDEGYLSFTLPVKPWEHLLSKTIVSAIWILIDFIVLVVSIIILVAYKGMGTEFVQEWNEFVLAMRTGLGMSEIMFLVQIVLLMVIGLISIPLMYYFSISIGQLFKSHKLLAAVIVYVITQNVMQVLSTVLSAVFVAGKAIVTTDMDYLNEMMYNDFMWVSVLFSAGMCAVFWLVNNYIMSKRLNLS